MILSLGKAALLAGAAAILAPVGAAAQDVRNLDTARSDVLIFEGVVSTAPARFRYTMQPGTSLRVDVVPDEGSELDPVVTITDLATGEIIAEDDDSGGNLASRVRLNTDRRRQIEIAVSSFAFFSGEETTGGFELQLRPATYTPPRTEPVSFGSDTRGRVDAGETRYYTISGTEGQLLEVAAVARGDDLDPMLALYQGSVEEEALATDDDGGEGTNSFLRVVLPATGTYTIAVSPYGSSEGPYTLRVAALREYTIQAPEQVLGLAERSSGHLGAGYEEGAIEPATITYQLTPEALAAIRAGTGEVTVNMTTPLIEDVDFPGGIDPFLELGFETPLGFASMMTNDDGGEGLNARLAVNLGPVAETGDWLERLRIRAKSIGGGGAFEIELVEGMQEVRDPYAFDENWYPSPEPILIPPPAPPARD